MTADELEDYVRSSLSIQLAKEYSKKMTIVKTSNPLTQSHTYSASLPITHTTGNTLTMSGFNGTMGSTVVNTQTSVQEKLRVIEYHKNGKVSRVELQYYDGENWNPVPRIKKEDDA